MNASTANATPDGNHRKAGCPESGHVRFGGRPPGKGPRRDAEAPRRVADPTAAEHVQDLADLLKPHLPRGQDPDQFARQLRNLLAAGRVQALAETARKIELPTQDLKDTAATAIGYFTHNAHRMRYARFKKDGLWIGSGAVEGACKNLVEARAALSGMRWTIDGLDPVIALRALHRSNDQGPKRYDSIWDRP